MLEKKLEELKTYSQEMERDKSNFDPNVLINISNRLVSASYELIINHMKIIKGIDLPTNLIFSNFVID